jgi:hypothetical protein
VTKGNKRVARAKRASNTNADTGNPGVDTIGPQLNPGPFDIANVPLVAPAVCSFCNVSHFHVGSIVPGFVFHCTTCGNDREMGLVIQCIRCHAAVCGVCLYERFVNTRDLPPPA